MIRMPHLLDPSMPGKRSAARRRGSQRKPVHAQVIASPLAVPFRAGARRVHSIHDAVLALLDDAIGTLRADDDDEAVHAVRRACKHVRAALRLLRGTLGPRVYRRENKRVRDAATLGAVRDAYMLRATLRGLPQQPAALRRGLESEYREARHTLERRGALNALSQLAQTRAAFLGLRSADSEASSVIAGVGRVYKAGRKARSKARHKGNEALHEWRKQAKYLLNLFELLKAVFNAKFGKLHRRAEGLADVLGRDHDLAVLLSKLPVYDAKSLAPHIEKRRHKLQARAFHLGRQLYRRPPQQLRAAVAAGCCAHLSRLKKSTHGLRSRRKSDR